MINPLMINVPHHTDKNQSTDLHYKTIDWFLYGGEHWSLLG